MKTEKITQKALEAFLKRYEEIKKEWPELISELKHMKFYQGREGKITAGQWYSYITIFDPENGLLFRPLATRELSLRILEVSLQTDHTYKKIEACINDFLFKEVWQATGVFYELKNWELRRKDARGLLDRLEKEGIGIEPYRTAKGIPEVRLFRIGGVSQKSGTPF